MADSRLRSGRVNQKRRTRAALVAAARTLLESERTPSLEEVCDAALVSRTTAYRYFSSAEALLTEVALENVRDVVEPALRAVSAATDDPATRLDALVQTLQGEVSTHETGFRVLLRQLVLAGTAESLPVRGEGIGRLRQGRRLEWIEAALASVRDRLDAPTYDRLVAGLALCMGIESVVVLRDVCALETGEAEAVSRWVAQALLAAALGEAAGSSQVFTEGFVPGAPTE